MYLVKAEANQIEKIVAMSVRAFETDVNVGGIKGDCPPEYDSIKWHQQMARERHLYQAMIGNDLVGAAIVFPDETGKSVYIGRIFIDSVYHRKGYGIRLMDCIEKYFPFAAEFNLDTPCWNERKCTVCPRPAAGPLRRPMKRASCRCPDAGIPLISENKPAAHILPQLRKYGERRSQTQ